jgi:hypothetical protein
MTTNGSTTAPQVHNAQSIARTTTALARSEPIEPQNMAELKDFATIAARSQFFGASTPEQALIIAMAGRDLGFSYTQALRAFYVVKGKPTLSADGMVAACLQHPSCEYFRPVRVSETEAVWVTKPRGGDPIEYRFTMEDAQRAGLVNEMYKKHPKRMLSARCKSYLARDVYPQLLMGLMTDDEAQEAAQREPQRVSVEQIAPAPDTMGAIGAMRVALKRCTTEADFKRVASAAKKATDKGEIAAVDFEAFKAEYNETKARVLAPPPPSIEAVVVAEADAPPEMDRGDDPEAY